MEDISLANHMTDAAENRWRRALERAVLTWEEKSHPHIGREHGRHITSRGRTIPVVTRHRRPSQESASATGH